MYMYIVIENKIMNVILIRESNFSQSPVYFISKSQVGAETQYQKIEKAVLALVTASRKLRRYFLAHSIIVHTYFPPKHVLYRQELLEFEVSFKARKALKDQLFAYFLAEMTSVPP